MTGFTQRWAQALTGHFQQAKARNMADLNTRTVLTHRFTQTVFYRTLVAYRRHVDEVDNNQAAEVTQAQLTSNLIGSFEVGVKRSFFISPPRVARAELMSMAVNASVLSITMEPPDGRRTSRWKAD